MAEFSYEIVKEIGVLSSGKSGWQKEVNLVSYNGAKPKLDIRSWQIGQNGERKMSKGVTLDTDEVSRLKKFLETL